MAAMHLDRYQIVPAGDHWAVRRNADVVRIFRQRTDAIRAAIEAAQLSQEHGNTAEVLTESWDGQVVPLFTFASHGTSSGL
jgi:hypothetical protein